MIIILITLYEHIKQNNNYKHTWSKRLGESHFSAMLRHQQEQLVAASKTNQQSP